MLSQARDAEAAGRTVSAGEEAPAATASALRSALQADAGAPAGSAAATAHAAWAAQAAAGPSGADAAASAASSAAGASATAGGAWAQLAAARDMAAFAEPWLRLQCQGLQDLPVELLAGVLIWRQPGGGYGPLSVWPTPRREVSHLGAAARRAIAERRGLCEMQPGPPVDAALAGTGAAGLAGAAAEVGVARRAGPAAGATAPGGAASLPLQAEIAYPAVVGEQAQGVVVIELRAASASAVQAAMQRLHWGAGWLESRARAQAAEAAAAQTARGTQLIDLMGAVGEQDGARALALTLVNELAGRLGASRVLLGRVQGGGVRMEAISHMAWFDRRSQEIGQVENLMEEALDQGGAVLCPPAPGQPLRVTVAHEAHRVAGGLSAVASALLVGRDGPLAVLSAEWPGSAPAGSERSEALALMEAAGLLIGPLLQDKLIRRRWLAGRAVEGAGRLARRLGHRGHAGLKLGLLAAAVLLAVLLTAEQTHRVTARAAIEGAVQRAAVAPFKGFIAAAPVRAGATVDAGQLLARLDDRDLRLEQVRIRSELEQAAQRYHEAVAGRDRAAAVMAAAQQRQAQAQLDLVEERLGRASIAAPIAGLVVSGDLSQLLGTPVEAGQTLFEVAPLDAYRVVLHVDERDIAVLQPGQRGQLVLTGLSQEPLPFTVRTLTAVAEQRDARNTFRVEAALDAAPAFLRPGMEGVGKVEIGERKLLWIWTHPFTDWLRLALWRWLP